MSDPYADAWKGRLRWRTPDEEFDDKGEYPLGELMGASLDEEVDEVHLFKPGSDPNRNPDFKEVVQLSVRAMTHRYISHAKADVEAALRLCGSPIEAIMLGAIIILNSKQDLSLRVDLHGESMFSWEPPRRIFHPGSHRQTALKITPQAQMGIYRVDFLLDYLSIRPQWPKEAIVQLPKGGRLIKHPEMAVKKRFESKIIVECDGHDFHERTKEQAAKDKRRDRELQRLGYKVYRFTGKEINEDSIACAREVYEGFFSSFTYTFELPEP